ncbi:unnamed protein product [Cylicocyclus nassatus]|uniref:Uncharacterized protein n=1 Tax=Cylicocyclus nassatus TaxID=53992 RepID=A0AA36MAT4_CYLNA|nr:unnamed protein product [Cylicocyclus nassatus]
MMCDAEKAYLDEHLKDYSTLELPQPSETIHGVRHAHSTSKRYVSDEAIQPTDELAGITSIGQTPLVFVDPGVMRTHNTI